MTNLNLINRKARQRGWRLWEIACKLNRGRYIANKEAVLDNELTDWDLFLWAHHKRIQLR